MVNEQKRPYDMVSISSVGYDYTTVPPTQVSTTVLNSTTKYNFLYAKNVAIKNPITATTSNNNYVGVYAINSLDFVVDRLVITNTASTTATVKLFAAYPFSGLVPKIDLAVMKLPAGDTVFLNKDEYDIILHTGIVASQSLIGGQVNTVTGYGLGASADQSGVQINGWGYFTRGE